MPKNAATPSTVTLTLFRLAALFAFLTIAMGAVVCATNSGTSCPTWPGCHPGQVAPQWQLKPVIEFTHRVVVSVAGPLILAAAVMSTRMRGSNRWARILPWLAVVGVLIAGAFGRVAVLGHLSPGLAALDLLAALLAMTCMTLAAVAAGAVASRPAPWPPSHRTLLAGRLAATSATVLIVMYVTGVLAAGKGSYTRCIGWPMWRLVTGDHHPWLQSLRVGLSGLGALLIIATVVVAVRSELLRTWGLALATLGVAEVGVGMLIRSQGLHPGYAAAYSVLAAAMLWILAPLMAVATAVPPSSDPAAPPSSDPAAPPSGATAVAA